MDEHRLLIQQLTIQIDECNEILTQFLNERRANRSRPPRQLRDRIYYCEQRLKFLTDEASLRTRIVQLLHLRRARLDENFTGQMSQLFRLLRENISEQNIIAETLRDLDVMVTVNQISQNSGDDNDTQEELLANPERVLRSHRNRPDQFNIVNPDNNRTQGSIHQEITDDAQYFQIFNCNLQENLELSLPFEQFQMRLQIRSCSICNEIDLESTDNICDHCKKFPHPNNLSINSPLNLINPLSELNGMQPGEIPDELKGLTILEQALISPIKPFLIFFKLEKNGQWGYSGNCISFNQDITELVTEIPRTLDSVSELVIIRRQTDDVSRFSEVRVRKNIIHRAIQWLLNNNRLYASKINFNQNNLDNLPNDQNVSDSLPNIILPGNSSFSNNQFAGNNEQEVADELLNDIDYSSALNFEIPDMRRQLDNALNIQRTSSNTPVVNMPTVTGAPISESYPGLWALAFPCLFPFGIFLN